MTREEADFIGGMNMCDEISNEAYKKIMCHCEDQEPCEDAISRQAVLSKIIEVCFSKEWLQFRVNNGSNGQRDFLINYIEQLPSVTPQQKIGRCKDCKYFEYDSVAKVDGMPLIVAHEICKRWGGGCKAKEDGYCFLFEPKMQEDENK